MGGVTPMHWLIDVTAVAHSLALLQSAALHHAEDVCMLMSAVPQR